MQDGLHKMIGQCLIDESEALIEKEASVKKWGSFYQRNKRQVENVANALDKLNIIRVEVSATTFDVCITGDKHDLSAAFGAFRKLGYEPTQRPVAKEPTFSCYWDHPVHECRFWLYFTSTACTRVQVGTKMVEQPVFETVCD